MWLGATSWSDLNVIRKILKSILKLTGNQSENLKKSSCHWNTLWDEHNLDDLESQTVYSFVTYLFHNPFVCMRKSHNGSSRWVEWESAGLNALRWAPAGCSVSLIQHQSHTQELQTSTQKHTQKKKKIPACIHINHVINFIDSTWNQTH